MILLAGIVLYFNGKRKKENDETWERFKSYPNKEDQQKDFDTRMQQYSQQLVNFFLSELEKRNLLLVKRVEKPNPEPTFVIGPEEEKK